MERYKSLFEEKIKSFEQMKVGDIIVWKSIRQNDEFKVTELKNDILELDKITKGSRNEMERLSKKNFNDAKKKGIIIEIK